jgi:hypothetical protein
MKNKQITKNMTFSEVMEKNPESAEILFENGLHCIGCGMAMQETLEDGCKEHGMNKKQIDELIKKINGKKK